MRKARGTPRVRCRRTMDRRGRRGVSSGSRTISRLQLQALLLADSIYQDRDSGKYVIAGTFHTVNVRGFPSMLGRSVGAFIALTGGTAEAELELSLVEESTDAVLLRSGTLTIPAADGDAPLELAVELPSLPL